MAPEVYYGQYDERADMYSLGRLIELDMQAPPNSRSRNLSVALTADNPASRMYAWQVRDVAVKNLELIRKEIGNGGVYY